MAAQSIELNQVFNGCGVSGMKNIPDKSVDMVFCDLPFGTTKCHWDKRIPFPPLWEQWLRVCKDNAAIILKGQQPFTTDIINSNRKMFRYEIIWEKTQKMGFLDANRRPLRGHENLLVFYKKQPVYNPQFGEGKSLGYGKSRKQTKDRYVGYSSQKNGDYFDSGKRYPSSVIKISNWNGALFGNTKKATKHPTQTPIALLEWLIKTYTNEGAVVLDNCMGSWSTAFACYNTNRNFIGWEKDPAIWQTGKDRYDQHIGSITAQGEQLQPDKMGGKAPAQQTLNFETAAHKVA